MKRSTSPVVYFVFGLSFLLGSAIVLAQTQRYSQSKDKVSASQFPLTVHVTGSHFSPTVQGVLLVDAVAEGENVKLETNAVTGLMQTGDYKARPGQLERVEVGHLYEELRDIVCGW